uniref:Opsin 5 n=1 Tax=Paramormyrops kingsleyae TaxID=1676925 RepID=A0A3B3SZ50_9TELE
MALTRNETALHSDYLLAAHYLLEGDPFASKLSKEADMVTAFYACIVGILSVIGNGYVLYVALKRKAKLRPPELMTMNLAIFDFGISVAGKPFFMASSLSHRWLFGWQGCRYYGWASFFFGCGSLITMTTISLDRYLKICHLRTWLQRQHAFLALIFIWVYATFWATMPLLGWGRHAPEPFVMSILFFCLILPISIIVFSYVKVIRKVKSSAQEVSRFDGRNKNRHTMEMKLTKVAVLICSGFLIAWIPYAVVSVWSAFGEPNSVPITVSVVPTLLAKSSAMYNPIMYQVINCKKPSCFKGIRRRTHYSTSRY